MQNQKNVLLCSGDILAKLWKFWSFCGSHRRQRVMAEVLKPWNKICNRPGPCCALLLKYVPFF